jgi:hypothetical protein
MIHHASSGFWECYQRLPTAIQQLADKNYEILKVDPDHPSLHFKSLVSRICGSVLAQVSRQADDIVR